MLFVVCCLFVELLVVCLLVVGWLFVCACLSFVCGLFVSVVWLFHCFVAVVVTLVAVVVVVVGCCCFVD